MKIGVKGGKKSLKIFPLSGKSERICSGMPYQARLRFIQTI